MNTCRAPPQADDDRFCSSTSRPDPFPPPVPADILSRPWRSPPHPCNLATSTYLTTGCCQDPSFGPDIRAKSTPPCDPPRRAHQVYPSPPLTDASLASTVPLPDLPAEPSETRFTWPDREEIVDENMSHDGARHLAPLSPPPTLLVGSKELPGDAWSIGTDHGVESWRYGDGSEDGGAAAPPFPPVRDDSGFEEFGVQGGCDRGQKHEGSCGDRVMIEPTSTWIPHSPLSMHDSLPLSDLPPLHGGVPGSGHRDSLFDPPAFEPMSSYMDSWGSESVTSWSPSSSSTVINELSAPPSPKPGALSLDYSDYGSPLGLFPHAASQQQQPSPISPVEIPYHQQDHHWYRGEVHGEPSSSFRLGHGAEEPPHPFFSPLSHFPLHPPPVDADLDSDYTDTVMPSEDDDSTPSSPRRRPLNELHDATPPHGDLCLTPAPHSPHSGHYSLPDFDMDDPDPSEAPDSPHSPHPGLPELGDEEMLAPLTELQAPPMDTISPALLGGAPPPERAGLGLFLPAASIDPPLARSPSPDEDDFQFLDVQLDPSQMNLEVDEFLRLRALRKQALQHERSARQDEAQANERVTAVANALLPPAQGSPSASPDAMQTDAAETKHALQRELHLAMERRADARRARKLHKQRSKEIGALLDLKMQTPVSPAEGFPPIAHGGKPWTRSMAHLVAHMVFRRRERSRPLENRPPPVSSKRPESPLRVSLRADGSDRDEDDEDDDNVLGWPGGADGGVGVDGDVDMEE